MLRLRDVQGHPKAKDKLKIIVKNRNLWEKTHKVMQWQFDIPMLTQMLSPFGWLNFREYWRNFRFDKTLETHVLPAVCVAIAALCSTWNQWLFTIENGIFFRKMTWMVLRNRVDHTTGQKENGRMGRRESACDGETQTARRHSPLLSLNKYLEDSLKNQWISVVWNGETKKNHLSLLLLFDEFGCKRNTTQTNSCTAQIVGLTVSGPRFYKFL